MSHVDPELLALLALGEEVASDEERDHIASCPECRAEIAELSSTVLVAKSALDVPALESPSPRVWEGISATLGLQEQLPAASVPPGPAAAPVVDLAPRRRRRLATIVSLAAAAAVAVAGVSVWLTRPAPVQVLASAELDAFPAWPDASGSATVEESADGRSLTVDLAGDASGDGYREVWLIAADGSGLVSLGVLEGDRGTFAVPQGVDLADYPVVDVSEEPYDGDPEHSGDSIVRGTLEDA